MIDLNKYFKFIGTLKILEEINKLRMDLWSVHSVMSIDEKGNIREFLPKDVKSIDDEYLKMSKKIMEQNIVL